MRFTFAAVLALGTTVHNGDAFLSPTLKLSAAEIRIEQKNAGALYSSPDDDEVDSGDKSGSRFQEMLQMAKQQAQQGGAPQAGGRAIENPFLNPTPTSTNPGDLSVEEQARMFREMMAGNQAPPQAPMRVAADPGGARPVGRNADADKIANTSDLYFAQLKRDSTVRTLGRIQGNSEVSEAVFQDDGIKELDNLLLSNPYLKGRQEEEKKLLENVPDEIIAPYFKSDEMEEEKRTSAGISYKQKLMERRKKKAGESAPAPAPKEEVAVASQAVETTPPAPETKQEPVVAQVSNPPPVQPEPQKESVVPQASTTPPLPTPEQQQPPPPPPPAPVVETPKPVTVTSSDDVRTQNLRTLMGLILKHRGGPGFGKGRLKGPDIDLFEGLIEEITNMLRDEAPVEVAESPPVVEAAPVQAVAVESETQTPVAASTSAGPANIDSTIACIEGAITMYNNSPPAIRDSVLVTLRAALMAAVDTCNVALAGQPAPPVAAGADASIEGMVACIEGAVTMYKNSPPALKESVMVTLRMALMSAVATCDLILGPGQAPAAPAAVAEAPAPVQAQAVVQPVAPVETVSTPVAPPPAPVELDRNSKALEKLYEKVQAASGDGKLGLRSDITPDEASALVDELVGMRKILMEELEAGIPDPSEPDPEPAKVSSPAREKPVSATSTASKYQQMLAKARAEKAKA